MSIARVADTDADATGRGGTIRDNAWKTTLYDQADAWRTLYTITSTGTVNDLSLTSGGVEADVVRLNNASALTVTGIAAPASPAKPGKVLILRSVGAGNVALAHENAGSTAANRLINLATSANSSLVAGNGCAIYVYDSTSSRWRMIAHDQGGWITPTFAAGNFTANGSMTWTLASGDRTASAYWLRGNQLTYYWTLTTTTVGGTVNTRLQIGSAEWGGFSASVTNLYAPLAVALDNGTAVNVYAVHTSATQLILVKTNSANWTLATDATYVYGSIQFQVT